MATWYIFSNEGKCVATMHGATPSRADLKSRGQFAVLDSDGLANDGDLMYVDGKIKKVVVINPEAPSDKEMVK